MPTSTSDPIRLWLIDPISYSGMAYSDVGQIAALQALGARPLLVGSESWMLRPDLVPRTVAFRGTHGDRSRLFKGLSYLRSLVTLVGRIAAHRPTVIHWQFTELPVADVIAMWLIRSLGIPQVYTAHELLPWSARRHHRWLFARLYRVVDAVVVHSDEQRAILIDRFGVPRSTVHVAPLGDYALFATPGLPQGVARNRIGVPSGHPVALFFGAIRPSKGLDVLLRAWPAVIRQIPDARLLVVGKPFKGLDTHPIDALIDASGIRGSVTTRFEQVDPDETNAYYRAADIVVLPYHEIGTSGVLRYAYDSARPVIATSVGEHVSRVIPDETGWLVPPGDPTALATALTTALHDPSKMAGMGMTARRYAETQLGWQEPGAVLMQLYEDLRQARMRR